MNANRLLAHYERIADGPDAIARLRRFIIDLAVRGKLVRQNPNDEPASELLERIAAERKKRIARREIRRAKPLNSITHTPFDPPSDWTWLPLGETGNIFTGNSINVATREQLEKTEEGRPFIATKDVGYGFDEIDYANGLLVELSDERFKIARSDSVLICAEGGSAGRKIALTDRESSFGNKLLANETWSVISSKFVLCVYLSDFFYTQFAEKMTGVIGGISLRNFLQLPFPLPPLAEQHRIVAKVDELMALCDRLEAARTARESTRDRLGGAVLSRLNAPDPDPVVFRNHAAFALENLAPLTTRTDQIKALRQTILNLAVRGKLVEQDPNDEPAAELLKRIAAEKARLVKEKRSRPRRVNTPAICSDVPFDLPAGWCPAKIEQILVEIQTGPFGSSLHQSDYQLGGTPVINPASIQNERIVPVDKMAVGRVMLERLASFKLRTGDVIMGRRGEMGRCAVVSEREKGWLCGTGCLILRALEHIYPRFLSMVIGSPFSRQYLGGTAVGTTMQNLNQTILLNLSFGIPPFTEQHRIVAKVDELMEFCDQLEGSLTTGDETRRRLLDALLYEALQTRRLRGHLKHNAMML